jgi:iron complex transport system substrate-binding protein
MQYGVFSSLGLELYPSAAQVPFIPITWRDAAHFDPQILLVCGRSPGQPERKRCSGCRIKKRPCIRDVQDIYRISDLAGVSSVRESKVFTVPCHFFCRPGPRLLEGMQWLLKSLSAE